MVRLMVLGVVAFLTSSGAAAAQVKGQPDPAP
jgi:hypothetical protein